MKNEGKPFAFIIIITFFNIDLPHILVSFTSSSSVGSPIYTNIVSYKTE
jgi:hypothetical protein